MVEHIEPTSISVLKALYRRYREKPWDPGTLQFTLRPDERPWHAAIQELLNQGYVVQVAGSSDSYLLQITVAGYRYIESNGIDVDALEVDYKIL